MRWILWIVKYARTRTNAYIKGCEANEQEKKKDKSRLDFPLFVLLNKWELGICPFLSLSLSLSLSLIYCK